MPFFLHHLGYIIHCGRLVTCFIDKQSQNKIEFSFEIKVLSFYEIKTKYDVGWEMINKIVI